MQRRNISVEKRLKKLNRIGERARSNSNVPTVVPSVHNIQAEVEIQEVLIKEETMQKLILDQPDRVTNEGTVETIIATDITLNEIDDNKKNKEVLITEDPMDGIQVILND